MFHEHRRWTVAPVESPEELARKLTEITWCCCNGFSLGGYLFLNDATCPDGAQEYAIVKQVGRDGRPWQIESVTFSWCDFERALQIICEVTNGADDDHEWAQPVAPAIETPEVHGHCRHCA
jgi:hypothetical protein